MIGDERLAINVNLLASTIDDKPIDLYQLVLEEIEREVENLINKVPTYARLGQLKLTRNMVKRSDHSLLS